MHPQFVNCSFPSIAQAQNLKVCSIDDIVLQKLKAFRFRKDKTNAAIISESTVLREQGKYYFIILFSED